VSGAVHIIDFD